MTNNFSQRLQGSRANKGLTQQELAEKIGVSLRTIQNWEQAGSSPPTGKNLRKLHEVLGVSISYLLGSDPVASLGTPGHRVYRLNEEPSGKLPSKEACMNYLADFLDTCDDLGKISWTYYHLQDQFPLDKWKRKKKDDEND